MSHPTMRAINGASHAAAIDAADTALIDIDFQREYFDGGKLPISDGPAAMAQARQLIALADEYRMPVFHVQHLGPADAPLFARNGEYVTFHRDLQPAPHHMILQKTTASSFASTDLHLRLQAKGIKTLIICGLMTHMCVSTAARDARPLGYQILIAGDACATRDIAAWDGGLLHQHDLHRAALTALADGFADVMPTARITALPIQSISHYS
jgi:nicotinamidase-related amidase